MQTSNSVSIYAMLGNADLLLQSVATGSEDPEHEIVTAKVVGGTMTPKAEKPAKGAKKAKEAKTSVVASSLVGVPGTIDGDAFILALKNAPYIFEQGRRRAANPFEENANRRNALRAYVGEVTGVEALTLAQQIDAARRKAIAARSGFELRRVSIDASVSGYVAGLPNPEERLRGDLEGKQSALLDAACKLAQSDPQKSEQLRKAALQISKMLAGDLSAPSED